MPYTTQDGFFDKLEDDIWKEVKNDCLGNKDKPTTTLETRQAERRPKAKLHILMRTVIGIAACIALLFVINMNFSKPNDTTIQDVDKAFSQLTDDDQTYLLNIYQADVFINE